jgi:hypothetical protein
LIGSLDSGCADADGEMRKRLAAKAAPAHLDHVAKLGI